MAPRAISTQSNPKPIFPPNVEFGNTEVSTVEKCLAYFDGKMRQMRFEF